MQRDILAAMNHDDGSRIKFLAPFLHNHMISAEDRHANYDSARDAADALNSAIITAKLWYEAFNPEQE